MIIKLIEYAFILLLLPPRYLRCYKKFVLNTLEIYEYVQNRLVHEIIEYSLSNGKEFKTSLIMMRSQPNYFEVVLLGCCVVVVVVVSVFIVVVVDVVFIIVVVLDAYFAIQVTFLG